MLIVIIFFFFFQAEDGIRDLTVTGVQTCALPILHRKDSPQDIVMFAGRSASRVNPITPNITMSWGLSFLCIPCATACADMMVIRSEERRVGKECGSRWPPYH